MKKIFGISFGGVEHKILNLVIFTVIIVSSVFSVIAYVHNRRLQELVAKSNREQKESITRLSSETIDNIVRNGTASNTALYAYIVDDAFHDVKNQVAMLGKYAQNLLSHPGDFKGKDVQLPAKSSNGEISIQLIPTKGMDISGQEVQQKISLIGSMDDMMTTLYGFEMVSSCFVALPEGALILADDDPAGKYDENGELCDFVLTSRPWYDGAVDSDDVYFSDISIDTFSGSVTVVCAVPVFVNGKLAAICGVDVFLNDMNAFIQSSKQESGFLCMVNGDGHVIFAPEGQDIFVPKTEEEAEGITKSNNENLATFVKDALQEKTGIREIRVDNRIYYMMGAPMKTVGWAMVSVVEKDVALRASTMMEDSYNKISESIAKEYNDSLKRAKRMQIILFVCTLLLLTALTVLIGKRIVNPLNGITKRIAELKETKEQFVMKDEFRTGDEIEILAESFADISARTALYIEEVKRITGERERMEAELSMATTIQASQVPHLFPAFPDRKDFDIYATMTPAKQVGGDFYDFFLLDDDHIALVMADVSGKGVPAALFMMVSKILIRNRLQSGDTPSQALANVNTQLLEGNDTAMFVTVWLAVLEISTGKGVAANAGHEHPVICRNNGTYELVEYRHSPAVATFEGINFRQHDFRLYPGDRIFVYTDGVPEATNDVDELFGTDRMLEALNKKPDGNPMEVIENVQAGINEFVNGAEQFDDITMLSFQYIGPEKS